MGSQAAFLTRVRAALQSGPKTAATALPDPLPAESEAVVRARLLTQRQELVARIEQELSAVGGQVVRARSIAEATQYVTQLAEKHEASLVVRWQSDVLDALEIDASLVQQGLDVHCAEAPGVESASTETEADRQAVRDLLARADIGLSGVDYAIAETGTLALSALPGQMRGVSLLPPVHVAVASSEQIVATLADCLRLFQAEGFQAEGFQAEGFQAEGPTLQDRLTSCVSFITGPSRTGDIELSLTVGVHGPGELHLVILDDAEASGC